MRRRKKKVNKKTKLNGCGVAGYLVGLLAELVVLLLAKKIFDLVLVRNLDLAEPAYLHFFFQKKERELSKIDPL